MRPLLGLMISCALLPRRSSVEAERASVELVGLLCTLTIIGNPCFEISAQPYVRSHLLQRDSE